ncbi:MAG: hypothetical protein LBV45_07560 [Xanthomonadaceae bacterium]|jgi:hypothetical protein|nr:hypothetical protein [Xanthomonadaceae bacterium]
MTTQLPDESPPLPDESVSPCAFALLGLSVCEASGRVHSWSLTLLCLTFVTGLLSSSNSDVVLPLLMLGLVPAGCQIYFAWRLAFDRQVFATWARLRNESLPEAMRAFDIALGTLLKKGNPASETRLMLDRVTGARRLHLLQIAALFGQALTLLILMVSLLWIPRHA